MAGVGHQYVVGELYSCLRAAAPAGWRALSGASVVRRGAQDRLLERELYAQWRIPHYWIVDVDAQRITKLVLTAERSYGETTAVDSWVSTVDTASVWPG